MKVIWGSGWTLSEAGSSKKYGRRRLWLFLVWHRFIGKYIHIFGHSDDQVYIYIFLIYICSSSTVPGSQIPKPLEFPERQEQWDIWSLLLSSWKSFRKGDFWIPPQDGGWLPGEPTIWLKGWNFQSYPLISREGREAGGWINCHWPMI